MNEEITLHGGWGGGGDRQTDRERKLELEN